MKNNDLDKFYTNPKIITKLIKTVDVFIKSSGFGIKVIWIEPSAGSGNFIDVLNKTYTNPNIKAFDISPHRNSNITKADFLKLKPKYSKNNVIIGNPPFGKRANLAIEFVNKSFEWADIVAFILPKQFKRFLTQKQINSKAKLIAELKIDEDSFLVNDRAYNVNCVFQIWVNSEREEFTDFSNKRIIKSPSIKHNDFKTFIYNNTNYTKKYFDKKKYKWDYAIPRQGYYDYSKLITNENELKNNVQYFFIKCENEKSKEIIQNINFVELSKTNTMTPGFSTSDFIKEYKKIKKSSKKLHFKL